jgi:hypothetical protein
MKLVKLGAALAVSICLGLIGSGCSHEDDILKQQADAKKLPPPSAAQLKKGFDEMARNHDAGKQEEKAWAAAHPDKVAAVNAARASAGKPPLGE